MKRGTDRLCQAWKVFAAVTFGVSFLASAAPDDPQPAQTATTESVSLDAVVVTGSAIRSADLSSENPITVITAEQLSRSGATTLQDFLATVPAVGFQGINSNQVSNVQKGSGNNFVDLRNLGPARTLVLIDGKRFPPSNNFSFEAVDIGNIPVSLIQRVEILRDGASPIYGSDAIGGVINVILRKRADGLEIGGQIGSTTHGDGTTATTDVTYGQKIGSGNLLLNFEFNKTDPILQKDRDWAHDIFLPGMTTGTLQTATSPFGLSKLPKLCPTGYSTNCEATGVNSAAPYYKPAAVADLNDISLYNDLTIGQQRVMVNALFDAPITDSITFYTENLFDYRDSTGQATPGSFKNTVISLKYPNGAKVPASAPGNPYGSSVSLSKQFPDYGPSEIENEAPAFRLLAGLRGELGARFQWDVSYLYGEDSSALAKTQLTNFTHALQEIGVLPCNGAAGCVPGNFFGPGNLSPAAANYLFYTGTTHAKNAEQSLDATISGTLPGLPAGPIGLAFGGDYRRLAGSYTPDSVYASGDQASFDVSPTKGAYDARELFFEAKLPVIAEVPLLKEFDVTGSTRYSKFASFGDATTWKAGIDWRVVDDLRIRGNHSTGFRAPSITELYLGKSGVSAAVTDPCDSASGLTGNPTVATNCAAQGVPANYLEPGNNYPTFIAGNPNLQPETSQSWNGGMVFTPTFVPHLSITLDYYNILIRNAIGSPNLNQQVDDCYTSPDLSSPTCADVGPRTTLASNGVAGQLTTLTNLETNLGKIKTDGLDLVVHYEFPLGRIGLGSSDKLVLDNAGSWIFSYDEQSSGASSPYVEYAGTEDVPTSSTNPGLIAHFRNNSVIEFRHDQASLDWTVRYIGGGNAVSPVTVPSDPLPTYPGNHTPAVVYHDLAGTYRWPHWTVSAGVRNLFDKDPPFWNDGTVNTNEFTYDTVGRFIFLNFKVKVDK
jgi:outer membrane receptor protein involved in Fe transport